MSPRSSARTVSGVVVASVPSALQRICDSCHTVVDDALADVGIPDPDPSAWYSHADVIELYDRLECDFGPCTLFRVGRELAVRMDWPDEPATVDAALAGLPAQYDRHHRGIDEGAVSANYGAGHGTLTLDTPYPIVFEAGLIRGVEDRFGTQETFLVVRRADSERTLAVRWWDEGVDHVDRLVPQMTRPADLDPDPRRASRAGTPATR